MFSSVWFIGASLIGVLILVILYVRNFYKLFKDINSEDYSLITFLRGIGVFVIPLGVVMGFV